MSHGLLFGLGAALAWGFVDVAAAIAGRRFGSLRVVLATQAVGLAVLGGLWAGAVIPGTPTPADAAMLGQAALAGTLAGVAYLGAFTALRIGPLSIVSPFIAAYGGLTVVLSVVIRGEVLDSLQVVGAAIATLGVVLVGLVTDGGWRSARIAGPGIAFALVATIGYATATVTMADPIRAMGFLPAVTLGRAASTLILAVLLVAVVARRPDWAVALLGGHDGQTGPPGPPGLPGRRGMLGLAAAAGLLDVAGLVAFGYGIQTSMVWLVGLASSFGPVFAVAVAVLVLGERPRPVQWAGMVAIGLGIVLIGLP